MKVVEEPKVKTKKWPIEGKIRFKIPNVSFLFPSTMLTLDEMTLFFYSYILSSLDDDKPRPSKKHKGNDGSILSPSPHPVVDPPASSANPPPRLLCMVLLIHMYHLSLWD